LKEKEDSIMNASRISEIKMLQDSINGYFVNQNEVDVFVSYLENIGIKLNTYISVNSIEVSSDNQNIMIVKLSATGTFNDVIRTISFIENIPYQVNVKQIYLNRDSKKTKEDEAINNSKIKIIKTPTWQADISFNILAL
jgi:hypothetical protein